MDVREILEDLQAEQAALDEVVSTLTDHQWSTPTPSPRWTVTDQIGHLTYFDGTAALAIEDPDQFAASRDALFATVVAGDPDAADELTLGGFRAIAPAERLAAWRENRRKLADAAATLADDARVIWYGPSMSAKSFLTARLMEAWAHGQDVVDAVGAARATTDRLRHIAQLGFITRGWTYANRGEEPPEETIRLELRSPSGATWVWGPEDADDTVTGSAEDFCLVVTQRRHLDDTGLTTGDLGRHWLLRAQAFAGGPTDGPAPRRS
jgi:uncharacterized protein (TIGR03084 family)